jgi:hypothetical protein
MVETKLREPSTGTLIVPLAHKFGLITVSEFSLTLDRNFLGQKRGQILAITANLDFLKLGQTEAYKLKPSA